MLLPWLWTISVLTDEEAAIWIYDTLSKFLANTP
jgi:hypothetical protein